MAVTDIKSRIKAICKAGAKGANRKERRANAAKAYKITLKHMSERDRS